MRKLDSTKLILISGILFVLIISHIPVVFTQFYHSITKIPSAENGTFNFPVDPGDKQVVLDGEWEFYWNHLLITDSKQDVLPDFYINVPDYWSKYQLNGEYLPSEGFASYRLILDSINTYCPVTIYLPDFGSAYKVFINGTLASESGVVSKNTSEVFTTTRVNFYPVSLPANQKHEVVIEVATTRFSGLYMAPMMMAYESAVQKEAIRNNFRFTLFGA